MAEETAAEPSDAQLARLSLAGSMAAFEELVSRHEACIYRFVCQRCRNPEDAKDITQTTFVSAFRRLGQFKPGRSFRGWLLAIARNRSIDFLRSCRPHETVDPDRFVDPVDPVSALEKHEQSAALWALARRELGADHYEALWLRYQEGLSVREIARVLRRTETGVKVILFRARQRLAAHLQADNGSGPDTRPARRSRPRETSGLTLAPPSPLPTP